MKKITSLSIIILLLSACASQKFEDNRQQINNSIQQEMQQAQAESQQLAVIPPAEIMNELKPVTGISIPGLEQNIVSESRFDVSVSNAPANVFFMSLVSDTDVNMVVHPSVSGTISLDLKNVTISEVMDLAREVYGYEFKKTGNGYIVLPARIQSKIFQVNYLNVKRNGESNMSVSSGQLTSGNSGSSDNASASSDNSGQVSAVKSSSIKTSNNANFWDSLLGTLVSIIGKSEGRSVVVDPQSGLVIVRAMPGELRDVGEYLSSAQKNLQRQVILEAKIIEVRLNDSFQSGIDWAALSRSSSRDLLVGQAGLVDGNPSLTNSVTPALTSLGTAGIANLFTVGGANDNFAALMRLLATQGEVQVLSSPRVSTVNNQKAVIKVGADEFFVTGVSSSTTSGGTSTTTSPNITLTPFFSGIALDVTPQISADNQVILHIHPSVSEVTDQVKNITVAGQPQQLPLALSSVRESDSVVKARSGQVIVIGGLMQNKSANDDGGVPGLSSIPLLGGMFKQQAKQNTRSELVILLKPIVADDNKVWSDYIGSSQRRIDQLQKVRQPKQQ
jgi:MSHA biogenesis protein MshL